jgi:hypothetical protein
LYAICVKVDFLPAEALSKEMLDEQNARMEALRKSRRTVEVVLDGEPASFTLLVQRKFPTNNGFMFDIVWTFEEKETVHRVILGRDYYEALGLEPEAVLDKTFAFLLEKKVQRQTEGASNVECTYFSKCVHSAVGL